MERVVVYGEGLLNCSVCAEKDLSREDIEFEVNLHSPSGTTNGWTISEDKSFLTGQPNPCPCDQDPEHRLHSLMVC